MHHDAIIWSVQMIASSCNSTNRHIPVKGFPQTCHQDPDNHTNQWFHKPKFLIFAREDVVMKRTILVFLFTIGMVTGEMVSVLRAQSTEAQSAEAQSDKAQSAEAQSAEEQVIRLKQETSGVVQEENSPDRALEDGPGQETAKPGHWDFSLGTSFSYMKGYGSGMMFYTAPSYTLALNDRWSLHGGVVASHYQGLNYTPAGENMLPGYVTSLSVFVAGSYRMTDRLVLHGAGVKQLISAPITPFTPYPMDDLSLGATYRIGDNFTVGASVHMRNGNGYYSTPFGTPYFPSSFGW
jgi:hypothetical protein